MNKKDFSKPALASPKTGEELLDIYFLDMRSALLETAAAMDRIERAQQGKDPFEDPRMEKLIQAADIIRSREPGRAERFLRLFSQWDNPSQR